MNAPNAPNAPKPTIHESAVGHVTGRAVYADE